MTLTSNRTEWLTLGEASVLLGVHPMTLRAWVDTGLVRAFRTPGGHRRFLRTELLQFMERQRTDAPARALVPASDRTLEQIRTAMGTPPIQQSTWYGRLSDEQRARHRELGQRLLGLLLQFATRRENAQEFLAQARDLAHAYGTEIAHSGLDTVDLARAFLFFRRSIVNAAYSPENPHVQADRDGVHLLQRINTFMDELLIATLEAYEASRAAEMKLAAAPAGGKRSKSHKSSEKR